RWNNRWHHWNNWGWNYWGWSPASYYYSYNSWYCHPANYWSGYHGYYGYSGFYNNYYYNTPFPLSYYNGITHKTVTVINQGTTRGIAYGPRTTTGGGITSPRGPAQRPGLNEQPVYRDVDAAPVIGERMPVTPNPVRTSPESGVTQRPDLERTPVNGTERPGQERTPTEGMTRDNGKTNVRQTETPPSDGSKSRPVYKPSETPRQYEPY